jgi:hypothetical protein
LVAAAAGDPSALAARPPPFPTPFVNVALHALERAYAEWFARIDRGELATASTPVEDVLAEVYALDDQLHGAIGRRSTSAG